MATVEIKSRNQKYIDAWNSQSAQAITDWWTDDVKYSDYDSLDLNQSKEKFTSYFAKFLEHAEGANLTATSVNGSESFTCTEWEMTFTRRNDGEKIKACGVTLMWWNAEGKITEVHKYNGKRQ